MAAPTKYPWDSWFGKLKRGYTLKLRKTKPRRPGNYNCKTRSFIVMFYMEAKWRKLKVSCQVRENGDGVDIKKAANATSTRSKA